MKPGRELDAFVAENVMGFETKFDTHDNDWVEIRPGEKALAVYKLGFYSTSISAAWEVVEKLGPDFNLHYQRHWTASICDTHRFGEERHYAEANTAPHAICLAALKAVGVKIEKT